MDDDQCSVGQVEAGNGSLIGVWTPSQVQAELSVCKLITQHSLETFVMEIENLLIDICISAKVQACLAMGNI